MWIPHFNSTVLISLYCGKLANWAQIHTSLSYIYCLFIDYGTLKSSQMTINITHPDLCELVIYHNTIKTTVVINFYFLSYYDYVPDMCVICFNSP